MIKKQENGCYRITTHDGNSIELNWNNMCAIANYVTECDTESEVKEYLGDMEECCDVDIELLKTPSFVREIAKRVESNRIMEENGDQIYAVICNLLENDYDVIEIFNQKALYTPGRLCGVPEGLYKYDIRGFDDTTGDFAEISDKVLVNHDGTVITAEPIDLGETGTISFTEETSPNFLGYDMTLADYLNAKVCMKDIEADLDAVFLPGTIHGCTDQLYILYLNPCACDGKGSWDIEIIDYETVLELYNEVNGDVDEFFAILPDRYHGRWCYCDYDHEAFESYVMSYHKADFIVGRDGNVEDELNFIINWARQQASKK